MKFGGKVLDGVLVAQICGRTRKGTQAKFLPLWANEQKDKGYVRCASSKGRALFAPGPQLNSEGLERPNSNASACRDTTWKARCSRPTHIELLHPGRKSSDENI